MKILLDELIAVGVSAEAFSKIAIGIPVEISLQNEMPCIARVV